MNKRDFETYYDMYQTILKALPPPDLMIYLECPIRTIKQRIKMRGRQAEKDTPTRYFKQLNNLYEQWIGNYKLSPVIRISTEKLDYISDFIDRDDLIDRIEKVL